MKLVLASRSPQRVSLLRDAGYVFTTDPADIDEDAFPSELNAIGIARWLAEQKALCVAQRHPEALVLGADTVVSLGSSLLGKPENIDHAREMISSLSGSTHMVSTGVAIVSLSGNIQRSDTVISYVKMRKLDHSEIENYVESGQWEGKAGGYGIQDDDPFVTCMDGSISNVIGLPMERTKELLAQFDLKV